MKFDEVNEMKKLLDSWKQLNSSFDKTCVCRIGINAGFFSEYRGVVDVILYCLENKIQFKLCSKWANFGYDKGWSDYFEPFCEEADDGFHRYCNSHSYIPLRHIFFGEGNLTVDTVKWKLKLEFYRLLGLWYKYRNNVHYYTQDIQDKVHPLNRIYRIPEWNFEGNYAEAFRLVNSFLWRFNKETTFEINNLISVLGLPKHYISIHVRGG